VRLASSICYFDFEVQALPTFCSDEAVNKVLHNNSPICTFKCSLSGGEALRKDLFALQAMRFTLLRISRIGSMKDLVRPCVLAGKTSLKIVYLRGNYRLLNYYTKSLGMFAKAGYLSHAARS
jgi:hypothetical protein